MKNPSSLIVLFISFLMLTNLSLTLSAQTVTGNTKTIQFNNIGGGQSSLTNEKTHSSSFSAKLVIPSSAPQGSGCMALYPYNKTLSSLTSFSICTSYTTAVPRFVIYLDNNSDGLTDFILLSDCPLAGDGSWQITSGGYRWGWTRANLQLNSYGKTWDPLDYWKSQYGNFTALFVGISLEYMAVYNGTGFGQPLYADELVLNGVTFNISPPVTPTPTSTPAPEKVQISNVQFETIGNGVATLTDEKVHVDLYSAKLVIPLNATEGSCAFALFPYNNTLSSLSSFSICASFTAAVPRFVIYLDKNNDGVADSILLSDYQVVSDGQWQITTGGTRWGWTETTHPLLGYGKTWDSLDYWKNQYENATVLYVGIALEYWAVYDRGGSGQPLYADELILNGVTYNIFLQSPTPTPIPTPTPTPTFTPTPTPIITPSPTSIISPTPSPINNPPPSTVPNTTITPTPTQEPTPTSTRILLTVQSNEDESGSWALFAVITIIAVIAAGSLVLFLDQETIKNYIKLPTSLISSILAQR